MGDERVFAADRAAWRAWLVEHHDQPGGVWLVYDKVPPRALSYAAIVEEALCFGWVDSTSRGLDDTRTMLYVAPRKRGSGWARTNKERIERLTAAGLMADAGRASVERAKADGSWILLDDVENLVEPRELTAGLDAVPAARARWDAFPPSARKAILQWITVAKRPTTRAARVAETVSAAAEGRRANEWHPKASPVVQQPEPRGPAAPSRRDSAGPAT